MDEANLQLGSVLYVVARVVRTACGTIGSHQLELGRLENRHIGQPFPPENSARVDAGLTESVRKARRIAHQTASRRELGKRVHRTHVDPRRTSEGASIGELLSTLRTNSESAMGFHRRGDPTAKTAN